MSLLCSVPVRLFCSNKRHPNSSATRAGLCGTKTGASVRRLRRMIFPPNLSLISLYFSYALLQQDVIKVMTKATKPQTLNPKPQNPNPKPQNPNTKHQIPHPTPQTPNPKPQPPNPNSSASSAGTIVSALASQTPHHQKRNDAFVIWQSLRFNRGRWLRARWEMRSRQSISKGELGRL